MLTGGRAARPGVESGVGGASSNPATEIASAPTRGAGERRSARARTLRAVTYVLSDYL